MQKLESVVAETKSDDGDRESFTSILIVDDAYDPFAIEDFEARISTFEAAVDGDAEAEALRVELSQHGCEKTGHHNITSETLEKMFRAKLSKELLENVDTHLFSDERQKRRQLSEIEAATEAVGMQLSRGGSLSALPSDPPDVVLLDYYLGQGSMEAARAQAVR